MATPLVWMLPPSCASRSTSMSPSRPMPTTAVMRIGWPNSTSPALKTDRPLTTPDAQPARVERHLAAQRDLADVPLGAPGALAPLEPRRLDVLRRHHARRAAARSTRGTGATGASAVVLAGRRASSSSCVALAAASALANAIVSSSGDRMSASFSRSPDEARRQIEQLRARAAVEAPPLALARHRHEVRVERGEALRRARDDRVDLDLHAEERREVRVGVEQRRVELRRADEDDAHADGHRAPAAATSRRARAARAGPRRRCAARAARA